MALEVQKTRQTLPRQFYFGAHVLDDFLSDLPIRGHVFGVVIGRSWARRSGVLDRVVQALKVQGRRVVVVEGVPPNPHQEVVMEGAQTFREHGVDVVVALGGGSVMDAAKAMALMALNEGDVWDYVYKGPSYTIPPVKGALPVVAISTVAASGSEFDGVSVITHRAERVKMPLSMDVLVPEVAVIDPVLHIHVPETTTALGVVDIFCQFLEPYLAAQNHVGLSDQITRLGLENVVRYGTLVVHHPEDVELRANLALLASLSINRWGRLGMRTSFSLHYIEHVVSGFYPEIPHPQGLASLLPAFLRFQANHVPHLLGAVGMVLAGSPDLDALLRFVENFLERLGVKRNLRDLGVREGDLEKMADVAIRYYGWRDGRVPGPVGMDREAVLKILQDAYAS